MYQRMLLLEYFDSNRQFRSTLYNGRIDRIVTDMKVQGTRCVEMAESVSERDIPDGI